MHSNHASVLASIACICAIAVDAPGQQAPINGMRPSEPARYALVGAKVIIAPGNTIDKATILIRNGVVESIGLDTVVPAGYRSFDFTGKTIFPAFIEPALLLDSSAQSAAAIASPGAHWNQYITPEVSAIALAIPDATLESLRAQGFAVARVMPANGIFRGSSDMRLLSKSSERSLGRDLGGEVAQLVGPRSFDFSQMFAPPAPGTPAVPAISPQQGRGERASSYPSSLMGSYAIMRQTFMDAN